MDAKSFSSGHAVIHLMESPPMKSNQHECSEYSDQQIQNYSYLIVEESLFQDSSTSITLVES